MDRNQSPVRINEVLVNSYSFISFGDQLLWGHSIIITRLSLEKLELTAFQRVFTNSSLLLDPRQALLLTELGKTDGNETVSRRRKLMEFIAVRNHLVWFG